MSARLLAVLVCMSAAGCSQGTPVDALDEPLLDKFSRTSLSIDSSGRQHAFSVYVADSLEERRQGLMFIEDMPGDVGMLFFFDETRQISMWMKNTLLPLDMLFVRRNGVIDSIAANTTPGSLKSIRSNGEVCCVLELRGGTAERLGIKDGDTLRHSAFVQ